MPRWYAQTGLVLVFLPWCERRGKLEKSDEVSHLYFSSEEVISSATRNSRNRRNNDLLDDRCNETRISWRWWLDDDEEDRL